MQGRHFSPGAGIALTRRQPTVSRLYKTSVLLSLGSLPPTSQLFTICLHFPYILLTFSLHFPYTGRLDLIMLEYIFWTWA